MSPQHQRTRYGHKVNGPRARAKNSAFDVTYVGAPAPRPRDVGRTDRRLPSLDGLRAASIILVLLSHLPGLDAVPVLNQLWRIDAGNLGVRVFFVISGFLITTLLLSEHARSGTIDLKRFYLRRTFRIMPPFYVFLLCMWIGGMMGLHQVSMTSSWHAATYLTNYLSSEWPVGHTWSLSVEEQFYLLWPGLIVLVGLRAGFRSALLMLAVSPLCRLAAESFAAWPSNPRYGFESVADALATGCLLARHRDALWQFRPYRAALESRWSLAIPVAVLAAAVACVQWPGHLAAVGQTLLNVVLAVAIDWCLRRPDTLLGRVLNLPPVAYVGTLSYSLYLWQQPFLNAKSPASLTFRLAGLVAFALASFYLVEQPSLRLRGILERRWRVA
jgi:peptidoglycan/LPS O-acetylase OafA/YrhL